MKRNKLKLGIVLLICLSIVAFAGIALADSSLGVSGPCYAVLTPGSASGTMNVSWWDVPEQTTAILRYGSSASDLTNTVTAARTTGKEGAYSAWTASMSGLSGSQVYYYQVGDGVNWSTVQSFTMVDQAKSGEVKLLYLGDAQYDTYNTKDEDYAAWQALTAKAFELNPDVDLTLLGGDFVQNGTNAESWQDFLKNAVSFGSRAMLPVPGNHESNGENGKPSTYLDFFSLPNNGPSGFEEEFYSYDVGNVHIVCLSSNILSNEQLRNGGMVAEDFDRIKSWISDDLSASDATWKIVVMHHPAYAVVEDSVASAVLDQWTPIFEDQQVDLVLCGHQHVYMRTKALHGVTYVMGVSGAKHYPTKKTSFDVCQIGEISNYQIITADDSEMTLICCDAGGNQLDTVTFTPKDRSITPIWHDMENDFNADDVVDYQDVEVLLQAIRSNAAYNRDYDINEDEVVNILDAQKLALLVAESQEGGEGID